MFNEIHGRYYLIIKRLLELGHDRALTENDIKDMIYNYGFEESMLHMLPKLLDDTSKDFYQLLSSSGNQYSSCLKTTPSDYLTNDQLSWLKAMILDRRIRLFFQSKQLELLEESLKDISPMYDENSYAVVGQSNDGDPYDDEIYIKKFRMILCNINSNCLMKIVFKNRYGRVKEGFYAPFRIEYSQKDDKFRLNVVQIERGVMLNYSRINIARIVHVSKVPKAIIPDNIKEFVLAHKVKEPVEIKLNNQRNGFDRFFIELANYERRTSYDEETGICNVKIYYYDFEEMELLLTLISYGPILEVIGPSVFKDKLVERIRKQYNLLDRMENDYENTNY